MRVLEVSAGRLPLPPVLVQETEALTMAAEGETIAREQRNQGADSGSSSSDSEDGYDHSAAGRKRRKHARARFRLAVETDQLTRLEAMAVSVVTQKRYLTEVRRFQKFCQKEKLEALSDTALDQCLLRYFNRMYSEGHMSHRGAKTLAAVLHYLPETAAGRKLPRAVRALKGWIRLCPRHSRQAAPLGVWCAIAWQFREMGRPEMSLFTIIMVATYARPSELLRARKKDFVPPASGVSKSWSLLLAPEEEGTPSKVGEFDDTVSLDADYLGEWLDVALRKFLGVRDESSAWPFTYHEYLHAIHKAAFLLQVVVTPYMGRHSGASIDRARAIAGLGGRSLMEVKKHGRWASDRSVRRYEKHARLAQTMWEYTDVQRKLFIECEALLPAIMLGKRLPSLRLPPRGSLASSSSSAGVVASGKRGGSSAVKA